MDLREILLLAVVCLHALAKGSPGKGDGGGHDDGGDEENGNCDDGACSTSSLSLPNATMTVASASSMTSSIVAPSPLTPAANSSGLTGDSQCTSLMCISAVVNTSVVEYTLQSTGAETLGWMAMGFGQQMADSPMIILWSNSDSSVTLSQRQAPAEVMPTVVSSPPRLATLAPSLTSLTGSKPQFGYSIPADSEQMQNIIWAFGMTNPESAAVDAPLVQHILSGTLTLNLAKPISLSSMATTNGADSGSNAMSSSPNPGQGPSATFGHISIPLMGYEKLIIAHAFFSSIGFLVLLPTGAISARYLRTLTHKWFKLHWLVQGGLAGMIIITGVALGIASVRSAGSPHLDDTHKKFGVALFSLYVIQCAFGVAIHFVKPRVTYRPPQNYMHAILGIAVIAAAFYQVRLGYRVEWPLSTGREELPDIVDTIWYIWVVLIPVVYLIGLFLLKKQFSQERLTKRPRNEYPYRVDEEEERVSLNRPEMREISNSEEFSAYRF